MRIEFQGESLDLDIENIRNQQAMFIFKWQNLTVLDILEGMDRLDPRVMLALYWLAHDQSGKRIDINQADFPTIKFMMAIRDALKAEKAEAEETEDPKDPSESTESTETSTAS